MAAPPLLLALDQGTSSSRAALFNAAGQLVASASAPLAIRYPHDGWVEQDPLAIWESQRQAMAQQQVVHGLRGPPRVGETRCMMAVAIAEVG